MPDIGASLREERMRSRIDITEIEAQTKIRAKYLRALENEEWDLLPGPTYVKTFLRTYADALGLDGRMLVEEYKLRHERLSDVDLQPISPRSSARERSRERRGRSRVPRFGLVALVVIGLVAALYALGRGADDEEPSGRAAPAGTQTSTTAETARTTTTRSEPEPGRLRITATGEVDVCVQAADGRTLVNGRTMQSGEATKTLRSRRFRMVLSNGQVRMRVNGRTRAIPESDSPLGYQISRTGRITGLAPSQRPTCGA